MAFKTTFLSTAKGIFKIIAWIALALGVLYAISILVSGGGGGPRWISAVGLIAGLFYFFLFYSVGEIINLLLEINSNTKKTE